MNLYEDKRLKNLIGLMHQVEDESVRQIKKWGIQERTAFEWDTYLTEEVGSLAKAINECEYRDGPREKVVSEAIQVATLALKIAEMFHFGPGLYQSIDTPFHQG
jgi:NTP pyrophosphatase (non-canonical NTP hydrolase)